VVEIVSNQIIRVRQGHTVGEQEMKRSVSYSRFFSLHRPKSGDWEPGGGCARHSAASAPIACSFAMCFCILFPAYRYLLRHMGDATTSRLFFRGTMCRTGSIRDVLGARMRWLGKGGGESTSL